MKKTITPRSLMLAVLLLAAALAGALGSAAAPAFAQTPQPAAQPELHDRVSFDEDLTIAEGEVVDGNVSVTNGDLIVFGVVTGKATVVNGDAEVHGSIANDLALLTSGDVVLHRGSKVGGNIVANGDIELQAGSTVNGSVTSLGGTVLRRTGAQVAGGVNTMKGPAEAIENFVKPWSGMHGTGGLTDYSGSPWGSVLARFGGVFGMGMFSLLVMGLAIALTAVLPGRVRTTTYTLQSEPGLSVIVGLITSLLLFPATAFIAVILTVSMVGIVLLPLLALAVLGVLLFGFVVASHWLGKRIFESARHGALNPNGLNGHTTPTLALEVITGAAVILGSVFLPAFFVPPWASLMLLGVVYLVSCLGLGAAFLSRFGAITPPRSHRHAVMYPTPVHTHYGTSLPHTQPERHNTRPLGPAPALPPEEHNKAS